MKLMIAAVTLLGLVGCSGSIVVHDDAKNECKDGKCKGVRFYQLEPVTEYYYLDRITSKDGSLTHWAGAPADKFCMPVRMSETKMQPRKSASRITYDAMPFETAKFSVDLTANGTLAKVGSDSTPGAKVAADTLAAIATSAKTLKDANVINLYPEARVWVDPLEAMFNGQLLCSEGRVPAAAPSPGGAQQ